jgi:hypothetical protein
MTRSGTRAVGATDAHGRATLRVASGEQGTLFLIPRSGSIGIARLERDSGEMTVRIPDGTASLEVIAETSTGERLSGVAIMMRIDGVLLPEEVRSGLAHQQGVTLFSDAHGRIVVPRFPPGRYELWPLGREEYRAALAGTPPPAPVRIALTPGQHSAKMVFEKTKK